MTYESPNRTDDGRPIQRRNDLTGRIGRYCKNVWTGLEATAGYLALIAAVEVAVATTLLSLRPSLAPVVVGLVTFAVYAADRIADVETDAVSNPEQAAFVRRHEDVLSVLVAVAFGLAVALSILGGPLALAITLVPGVFWLLYASDWVPDVGLGVRRLKDVLLVNTAVVAFAWAVTLTFLPLAFADASVTPTVGAVFAYFFFRSFVDAELPNVGDLVGDREIGVATLPVVFGVDRTRQALYGVDLITIALLALAVSAGYLSLTLAVPLLAGVVYSLGVTSFLGRADVERLAVAAECEYLVVALALVPVLVS